MSLYRYNSKMRPSWLTMGGVTLIEMMVAMGISVLLGAGFVQMFVANQVTYNLSESLSRMQENSRYTMDHLKREIQMAGFNGCDRELTLKDGVPGGTRFIPFPAGSANPIQIRYAGDDLFTLQADVQVAQTTPLLIANNVTQGGRDAATDDFESGQRILIGDCMGAYIMDIATVTSIANGVSLAINGASGVLEVIEAQNSDTNEPHGWVRVLHGNSYQVQDTGRDDNKGNPVNALFRTSNLAGAVAQELIEGVDAMRIKFGVTVGNADDDDDANDLVRYMTNVTGATVTNIRDAEIGILVSSIAQVRGTDGANEYVLLGSSITVPVDRRLRKPSGVFVNVRNSGND